MSEIIRRANKSDGQAIERLYRATASVPGFLARSESEISAEFVQNLIYRTEHSGLFLLRIEEGEVIGAIHAVRESMADLQHVFGQLTILVHPDWQAKGFGKSLFRSFLMKLEKEFPSVLRVELRARASHDKALCLYRDLGFVQEGRFISRIRMPNGQFEDGIAMAWINPKWKNEVSPTRKFHETGCQIT